MSAQTLRQQIEAYIEAMAAEGNADFTGWDIHDDLRKILDRVDGKPSLSAAVNPWGGEDGPRRGEQRLGVPEVTA